MKKAKSFILAALIIFPAMVFAQKSVTDAGTLYNAIVYIVNLTMQLLIGLAVFILAWGIFKFIYNAGDEAARAEGRQLILWGIIGIFAMVSVWGLVNIIAGTLSLNNETSLAPQIEYINTN